MESQNSTDSAAAARRAWFGKLPERIRHEDMAEPKTATPNDPTRYAYEAERSWMSLSCLVADLGL
ncbi:MULTISPECIES: hypothetical protein [Streptomyces]|uniref:Uncharacterized protein n=1 Tax=Streptomyces dengpaensis TaxID=2049881 RepID=A0ABM6ST27_9ACTN|nr:MULTISPECIES: hypothetical protein [Streptomyces]AVH57529.1 hypothetical protein C4B68_19090 [Streptomyces dengpaensis]PIB04099.1 hypothetical protein B1C81_34280 [Streptomyces sp. HG99]